MKETPPVLTAGPAAWIRDRGRKRSRLLGTRPSRATGGRGARRPGSRPGPRAGSAFALIPSGARGKSGLSPRLAPATSEARRSPGACRGAGQPRPAHGGSLAEGGQGPRDVASRGWMRQGSRGSATQFCTLNPVGSEPLMLVKWERTSDPTSPGVGRPAPQLETPRSRGGPSHIRLRP